MIIQELIVRFLPRISNLQKICLIFLNKLKLSPRRKQEFLESLRREREKNEIASNLKKHQEEQTNTQNFSALIQLQGLKLLKSFMEEDDNKDERKNQQQQDQVNTELKECCQRLDTRQGVLEEKVDGIQSSLSEILTLLKK